MRNLALGVLFVVPVVAQAPEAERRPDAAALYEIAIEEATRAFGGDVLDAEWNPWISGTPEVWRFDAPEWRRAVATGAGAIHLFEQAARVVDCTFPVTANGLSEYDDRVLPLAQLATLVAARGWSILEERPRDAGEAAFTLLSHARHVSRHTRGSLAAMMSETLALSLLRTVIARIGQAAADVRDGAVAASCRRELLSHAEKRLSLAGIAELHVVEVERLLTAHLAGSAEVAGLVAPESTARIRGRVIELVKEAFAPLRASPVPDQDGVDRHFRAFVARIQKGSSIGELQRAAAEASGEAARELEDRVAAHLALALLIDVPALVAEDMRVRERLAKCQALVAD
jgi:hypothetical protein